MSVFSIAKDNLRSRFKERFKENDSLDGFIFYQDNNSKGYSCSTDVYHEFVNDFNKALKWGTRVLWLSLLIIIPLLLYIEHQTEFEFTILSAAPFLLMPFPLAFSKVVKSYNAPMRKLRGDVEA